jgi:hypothetical protein
MFKTLSCRPHIINGQRLKQYLAGQNFLGNVEEVSYTSPEKYNTEEIVLS